MKNIFYVIACFALLSIQCSKNGKGCWQAFSPQGVDVFGSSPLCDITKKEAEEHYPQYKGWFYRAGETKNCYKVTKTNDPNYINYWWGIPGSMKGNMEQAYSVILTWIDCASFCRLIWNERHKSKTTGSIVGINAYSETLLNADSCSKLYKGRIINLWETADSIAYLELVDRYP
jgi:hypothetical protein